MSFSRAFGVVVALLTATVLNAQPQSSLGKVSSSGKVASPYVVSVWPQIPFVRGKDLCQYHDAYSRSKSDQMAEITQTIRNLLREGVDPRNMVALLNAMEGQVNQQRTVAGSSPGMDVMLAGTLKASLDKVYRDRNPQIRRFVFFNTKPLNELLREMRTTQTQAVWDPKLIKSLSGGIGISTVGNP